MKTTLKVEVGNYEIEISDDPINNLKKTIDEFTNGKRRLFVISSKVFRLYNKTLGLDKKEVFVFPDGEKEKNFKNYQKILKKMFELKLSRKDALIAVGGGVVGDITGFAASTYMRGLNFIQIPTTLLAMVDSSVGGKTAINTPFGKNLIGSFYQPKKVFININFLKTLDKKQLKSGIGEVLKYSLIEKSCGTEQELYLFEYLMLSSDKLINLNSLTLMKVIDYCLQLKISVVNKDEKEAGLRKILNLGHTLAHALETITRYKKFSHGEAVVYGMYFVLLISYDLQMINHQYLNLANELLAKYGFSYDKVKSKFSAKKLENIMSLDKKAQDNLITLILPYDKKEVKEVKFSEEEVLKLLQNFA